MFASLLIGGNQAPAFSLADFGFTPQVTRHCEGRHSGRCEVEAQALNLDIPIPQRDKFLVVSSNDGLTLGLVEERLHTLDSDYPGATQLTKLNYLLSSIPDGNHFVLINNRGTHGNLSLLSRQYPIYFFGIYEVHTGCSHLVWTSVNNFEFTVRSKSPLAYLFYRFPVIENRAMFIPTQAICAHWWKYQKSNSPLFSFNALELKLFKGGALES